MSDENRFFKNTSTDTLHPGIDPDTSQEDLLDTYLEMPTKLRDVQFIDTASAAERAGLSQRTIQLWIESGDLRAVVVGKKYKVLVASLVACLKDHTRKRFD